MPSRRSILTLTLLVGSQLWAPGNAAAQTPATDQPAAPAQTATPPADTVTAPAEATTAPKAKMGEEIVVTGSRIRRKDLTTPAPVAVISREQVLASGKVSVGDFLQSLPEQGNAINTSFNNGGDGSTRINLRGLGSARTLVLLNGRRFPYGGTGADASVDLNSIPSSVIERIEILKDGASAVYGSDAIAGVVNIITRKKYDGVEASAETGISTHGDGQVYDVSATAGVTGEKGSALFSAGFFRQEAVWASGRSWSLYPLAFRAKTGQAYGKGSTYAPWGRAFLPADADGNPLTTGTPLYQEQFDAGFNGNGVTLDPTTGQWRQWKNGLAGSPSNLWYPRTPTATNPSDRSSGPGDEYDYQPFNYLITPQTRITLFSTGDYNFSKYARAYYEASFVRREADTYQAPDVFAASGENINISATNQFNPFGVDIGAANGSDYYRRMAEIGPRRYKYDLQTFRGVVGVDGTLPDAAGPLKGWFWDLSLNYGRSDSINEQKGNLNRARLQDALGPSYQDSSGAWHCGTDPAHPTNWADCVPVNMFGGLGTMNIPDGLRTRAFFFGYNDQLQAQVNTSGELFRLFADRAVALAAGYEWRRLRGAWLPDALIAAQDITGNKAFPTEGAYTANEGYAELSIPVVSHLPFAESIEATAAARVFHYSAFGGDWTYKFGARWTIIPDFTLRGTYSTAYRAPNISDLYSGQYDSFEFVSDPCSGPNGGSGSAAPASCGKYANNGDPAVQLRTRFGGNPNVKPETAKIFTLGAVIEPRYVKNLTATVDYYNITLDNSITTLGASVILSGCYPADGGPAPKYCDLVQRDPITGRITNITNLQTNVGGNKTDGIDFALRYGMPTEYGRFGFLFDGTWLNKFDQTLADGTVIHGKGTYDLGIYPEWKFNAGVTYALAGLGAGVNARFVGSSKECGAGSSGTMTGAGLCYVDSTYSRTIDAWAAIDLVLSYTIRSDYGRTSIAAGVNNVFDANPARVYNGSQAQSDASTYDYMGRYFYLRLTQAI